MGTKGLKKFTKMYKSKFQMKVSHNMFHSTRDVFPPPEINSDVVYKLTFLAAIFT